MAAVRTGSGNADNCGDSAAVYFDASIEPVKAMPSAAPTSRVVSLTAEATPCLSSGTELMIAEVVGAVHNPMPELRMSSGHARSQYGEPISSTRMLRKPADTSSSPTSTTSRRPSRGTYQNDRAESTSIGPVRGVNANAVLIASYPITNWMYCMDRKKKPNMARKKTVIAEVPVVKVGSRNSRTSNRGWR